LAAAVAVLAVLAVRVAVDRSDRETETAAVPSTVPASGLSGTTTTAPAPGTSSPGAPAASSRNSTPGAPRTSSAPRGSASAAPAGGCPAVPARTAPAASRPQYRLEIAVDLSTNTVRGELHVRFTPDVTTDRLVFRLWPNGPRPAGAGAKLEAGPVTVDDRATPSEQPNPTTLVVRPPGGVAAGDRVAVAMPWRLTLPGTVNDRISRSGSSVRLGSFFPILAWEPGVGWAEEPPTAGFAEASTVPVADFDVGVSLPPGLGALATGVFDGRGRWTASAVRDFAVSVGAFRIATGVAHAPQPVRVTVGVAAGIGDDPGGFLAKQIRVLEDFGNRFGPYPWPELTMGITPDLSGGIEYPGHIMQGPGTGGRTTSHEVGHMWFYALVGNNQGRDPWLDEGLATWAEAMFEGTLASIRSRSIPAGARGHVGEPMTYWAPRQGDYYEGVYVQGAQALAAAGEQGLVDCALRHYVAANAHRVARPRDLLAALELVVPGATGRLAPYGVRP
jgi:hypothetical protein